MGTDSKKCPNTAIFQIFTNRKNTNSLPILMIYLMLSFKKTVLVFALTFTFIIKKEKHVQKETTRPIKTHKDTKTQPRNRPTETFVHLGKQVFTAERV